MTADQDACAFCGKPFAPGERPTSVGDRVAHEVCYWKAEWSARMDDVATLRAALGPFAALADALATNGNFQDPKAPVWGFRNLTLDAGDFQAAAAALKRGAWAGLFAAIAEDDAFVAGYRDGYERARALLFVNGDHVPRPPAPDSGQLDAAWTAWRQRTKGTP